MPFKPASLVPLCHGGDGFCFWHYTTADPAGDLTETGYFASAGLRVGDMILAVAETATALPVHRVLVVREPRPGLIEIDELFPAAVPRGKARI